MTRRTVILAGATGLVGRCLLEGLLEDPGVVAVHGLGRRESAIRHPKLTTHIVDFAALPSLPPADEIYLALGTTIDVAGRPSPRADGRLATAMLYARPLEPSATRLSTVRHSNAS